MQKASVCASLCKNYEQPTVYYTSTNTYKTQYATSRCLDCNAPLHMWWNLTHPSWRAWELKDCKHPLVDITVDETKLKEKFYNPNPDYPLHFMAFALLTYKKPEYWLEAPGTCQICGHSCTMRSDYDSVKKDGKDTLRIHGWTVK